MPRPLNPAATPFVLAAPPSPPSPPSLDNLTLAEDPPAASWSRLPTKIKERIVHHVLAIIEEQEIPRGDDSRVPITVGFFARKEISDKEAEDSIVFKVSQLKRLETLNRELRDICVPLAWQALPMCTFDKAALERLEEVIRPHASHIRFVNFGGVTVAPCCGSPMKNADARARDKVASRLARMCDNAEEVYMTEPRQQPDGIFQLERLHTAVVATTSYSARDFAFLQRQPHLEALSVQSRAPPLGSDSVQLAQSLSRFSHPKHLHVKGTKLVSTAFLERAVAIPSPFEGIELVSAEADISFDALAAFLNKFSATLVSIDLNLGDVYSLDLWEVDDGPSLELPRLETLGVGTDFDEAFFLRLLSPDMPLSFFRLDYFPSIAKDPLYLVAFLRAHAATLERVHLSREALDGSDHWGEHHIGAALEHYVVDAIVDECAELGIECSLAATPSGGSTPADSVWVDGDEPLSEAEAATMQRLRRDIVTVLRIAAQEGPDSLAEARRRLERTGRVVFVDPQEGASAADDQGEGWVSEGSDWEESASDMPELD